jgi:hypothetical protein
VRFSPVPSPSSAQGDSTESPPATTPRMLGLSTWLEEGPCTTCDAQTLRHSNDACIRSDTQLGLAAECLGPDRPFGP